MITENTVFILGAGASCPYGFPSGAELREDICSKLKNNYVEYINANFVNEDTATKSSRRKPINDFIDSFRESHNKSIDIFIARNPKLSSTGKHIISYEILSTESQSGFGERSPHKEQNWYSHIFDEMTNNIIDKKDIANFSKNKISFITFNYDRSLEHFFYTSLCNSFSEIPKEEIAREINRLNIIHVYGYIAPLDWQNDDGIPYGTKITENVLSKASQNLKTIYEVNANIKTEIKRIDNIRQLILKSRRLFSLGFSYAEENMKILVLQRYKRLQ